MTPELLQYLSPSEREDLARCPLCRGTGIASQLDTSSGKVIPVTCTNVRHRLLTSLAETRAVLAEHEWKGTGVCITDCNRYSIGDLRPWKHAPDCWLARLLHPAVEKG